MRCQTLCLENTEELEAVKGRDGQSRIIQLNEDNLSVPNCFNKCSQARCGAIHCHPSTGEVEVGGW